jgi:hypothetical protein
MHKKYMPEKNRKHWILHPGARNNIAADSKNEAVIMGELHLVSLCDNGPAYSAMIVKCFLALQRGVQPLILLTWHCAKLKGRSFHDIKEIKNNILLNFSFVHL